MYNSRFLGHSYEFGPKDFIIILTGVLQLLLIGFTIYQYLPSAPKGIFEYDKINDSKTKANIPTCLT